MSLGISRSALSNVGRPDINKKGTVQKRIYQRARIQMQNFYRGDAEASAMLDTKVFCPCCKNDQAVVNWDRDDPVLECGHIKRVDRVEQSLKSIFRLCFDDQTAFCPDCKAYVTVIHSRGKARCGGNLLDNPGCGRVLRQADKHSRDHGRSTRLKPA